jgi:hypothetical protein
MVLRIKILCGTVSLSDYVIDYSKNRGFEVLDLEQLNSRRAKITITFHTAV